MSRPVSKRSANPFEGLQLPVRVWKALEDANITSLEQLKAIASRIDRDPRIGPELAHVIKDRLQRLAGKKAIRVRFVFPTRSHRQN
jgi:hypothetical protein